MSTDFWTVMGGHLQAHDHDFLSGTARVVVRGGAGDPANAEHEFLFQGVHGWRAFNEIEVPWSFADCTAWELTRLPSGRLQLEIVLWDEEGAGLMIEFETGSIDGVALDP